MSDFLDYYKKTEQAKAMTEEEQLELHKKHKLITARRHQLEEDDDFYKDDLPQVTEGTRIFKKPVRRPAPVPAEPPRPRPVPQPAPQPRPAPAPIQEPEDFFDDIPPVRTQSKAPVRDPFDSIPTPPSAQTTTGRKRKLSSLAESTNPALREAYSMMDEMQQKIETMFYRYGMAGLEKINECMEEVFEDIVNPKAAPEPEIRYIEKPVPAAKPKKKIVKKTTTIKESDKTATPEIKIKKTAVTPQKVQQAFEDINNSFDVTQIGASLSEANNALNESETIAAQTLKKVQANAMLLKKSFDKKEEEKEKTIEEDYVQPEEFDIVDDDVIDDPIAEAKDYGATDEIQDEHTANIPKETEIESDET